MGQTAGAAGFAEIDSPVGAFAYTVAVAVELSWTLLTRFLAGTVCSLSEPASLTLKNGSDLNHLQRQ